MKSNQLTKNQAAIIIIQELKMNEPYINSILLSLIIGSIFVLLLKDLSIIIALLTFIIQGLMLLLIYKNNKDLSKRLTEKYLGGQ
ncbi:MAG TPA: hypothetical protein PKN54_02290 [Candidatus Cloacimonas acidaminovorans]|nr:hypothetical protein [Candidatus Cloacimonas acidaminovorans]